MSGYFHRRVTRCVHSPVDENMGVLRGFINTTKLGKKRSSGHNFLPQKRHGPKKGEGQEHHESFLHSVIIITRGNLDIQKVDWIAKL